MFHVAELAQQAHSLLGLVVGDGLLLVEGAHQGGLGLGHQARVGGQLLQLAEQVRVLGGDPSLALLEVAEVEVHLKKYRIAKVEAFYFLFSTSSIFLLRSVKVAVRALWDFSAEAWKAGMISM